MDLPSPLYNCLLFFMGMFLWALYWWFYDISSSKNTFLMTENELALLYSFPLSFQLGFCWCILRCCLCPIELTAVNHAVDVSYFLQFSLSAAFSYWVVNIFVALFHSASTTISNESGYICFKIESPIYVLILTLL